MLWLLCLAAMASVASRERLAPLATALGTAGPPDAPRAIAGIESDSDDRLWLSSMPEWAKEEEIELRREDRFDDRDDTLPWNFGRGFLKLNSLRSFAFPSSSSSLFRISYNCSRLVIASVFWSTVW